MLAKWAEITSCNGVIDLYQARKNKRHFVFWFIVMVAMVVASVYFTYRTIMNYFETPYVTNVATIPVSKLELPEILICYNGGLNVPNLKNAGFPSTFIHTLAQASAEIPESIQIANETIEVANETMLNYMTKTNQSYRDFFREFGFKCEEILSKITTVYKTLPEPCNSSEEFSSVTGPCFAFKNKGFQWNPMHIAGIFLILKAPRSSYATMFPNESLNLNLHNDFSITIEKTLGHNPSLRQVNVPLNTKAEIILNPIRLIRVDARSKKCEHNTIRFPTSNACFFQCWVDALKNSCSCIPINFVGTEIKPTVCNPFDQCVLSMEVEYLAQVCSNNCLRICDEWVYEKTVSYTPLDASLLAKRLSNIFIYFNTMQYTQIEEVSSFTFDMAVSNVGGQAGLWLGISIVTIIQAIYYLVTAYTSNGKVEGLQRSAVKMRLPFIVNTQKL